MVYAHVSSDEVVVFILILKMTSKIYNKEVSKFYKVIVMRQIIGNNILNELTNIAYNL
jgi:hypothetical protein